MKEIVTSELKKEIIAFANTDGGEIYIGVNRDGEVVGITDAEKEMERISSMIHDGIHPDLIPFTVVEQIKHDEKNLICIKVSRGGRLPYHLSEKGLKPSGVYVRHGVTAVPASEELIREMIRQSDGMTYDKARSMNQELTFQYAERYFAGRNLSFRREQKRTLGLIDKDGYYTNTALLFSDQCEHNIKCAVFDGTGKMRFKARKEFEGSVLKQLEDAYEYISLHNNVAADFVGLERIETFDYPEYALREALLNAIVHRDYNYSGSIIVNIFSDRMEFVSLGGLVKGIEMDDIMRGISQSRNMVLANVFYRLKLIESYGTGIQRILESYRDKKQPEFEAGNASFVAVIPKFADMQGRTDADMTPEGRVLQLLVRKKEITRKDIENMLKCSSFPARKIISSLMLQNKIRVMGNGKATKYVLTDEVMMK